MIIYILFSFTRGMYWYYKSNGENVHFILSSQYETTPSSVKIWIDDDLWFEDTSFLYFYKESATHLPIGVHKLKININDHEFSTVFYVFPVRWIYIEILNEEYTEWQESKIFIDFSLTPIKLM